jgi:plastocyanin
MTRPRAVAVSFAVALVTAACSNGSNGKSGALGSHDCAQSSATTARQTLITTQGFAPSCVKIKAGQQFFFVNNDANKPHSATTAKGSPTTFDADLPKKNSTYTQVFKSKGTYAITDKKTSKKMTLIVY